jgi:hypothetical protein
MVLGILCDNDVQGQVEILRGILAQDPWLEFWESMHLQVLQIPDLNLDRSSPDRVLWEECQRRELVLITGNRSASDEDSLAVTIQRLNTPTSLPVLTLANPKRIPHDKAYAERTAIRMLDYLLYIEDKKGTGHLFVP